MRKHFQIDVVEIDSVIVSKVNNYLSLLKRFLGTYCY